MTSEAAGAAASLEHVLGVPALLESTSRTMQQAITMARRAAASDVAILLTGEKGTGKEVLAAAIHAWSPRRAGPLIAVRCTTLTNHPLDNELFGPTKRTFTAAWYDRPGPLEAARGGTLFLDEIGDLPLELQAQLLRVVAEQRGERAGSDGATEVDARIIAATHRNLEADVRDGRFREDLFFRLSVVTIALPPLREREEDLPALTDHILTRLARRYRRGMLSVSPAAREIIAAYRWPGNARELMSALERAVVLSSGDTITPEHLPDRVVSPQPQCFVSSAGASISTSLKDLERQQIERVIGDSRTLEEAAARLGINAATLWRKRKRYGLG